MLLTTGTSTHLIALKIFSEGHASSRHSTRLHAKGGEGALTQHENNMNFREQKVLQRQETDVGRERSVGWFKWTAGERF